MNLKSKLEEKKELVKALEARIGELAEKKEKLESQIELIKELIDEDDEELVKSVEACECQPEEVEVEPVAGPAYKEEVVAEEASEEMVVEQSPIEEIIIE